MKIKFAFAILSIFVSTTMNAAVHRGQVEKLEYGPYYGSIVHVALSGDTSTPCATNQNGFDYSFDVSSDIGMMMFSSLLAAQRSGVEVSISGTGECTVNVTLKNTEDIRWIQSSK
ncbi:hypothetical protein [Shewanella algae]|uniref:hypothetical protein n=1 Tax=Shewanella algae TaxID=38313 RepID=UPI0005CD8781|nr:hypothetical protein [Shewanella algae]